PRAQSRIERRIREVESAESSQRPAVGMTSLPRPESSRGALRSSMTSFRPYEHLRRPADFRRVYDARRSASNDWLIIYAAPNERHYSRLGLSVSRKYGGSVQRNRLRPLYREGYRLSKSHVPPGLDLVFIPTGTCP